MHRDINAVFLWGSFWNIELIEKIKPIKDKIAVVNPKTMNTIIISAATAPDGPEVSKKIRKIVNNINMHKIVIMHITDIALYKDWLKNALIIFPLS